MENVIRRGLTFYARFRVPEDRWADVGAAMSAPGGVRREVVRTLKTTNVHEAKQRRNPVLTEIQAEIERALRKAGKKPLADWTADWMVRALAHRADIERRGAEINGYLATGDVWEPPDAITNAEITHGLAESDAEAVDARRGPDAARQFLAVALGEGLTIADGQRRWLAGLDGARRVQTIKGHEAAFGKLAAFLNDRKGWASLEGVGIQQVTRQMAGEFLAHCCTLTSHATVKREASAYNGLWRWAVRRGYAESNPFDDQTAGLGDERRVTADEDVEKRGYTSPELIALLNAGADELAPNKGGYGAAFFDLIRLLLLTGARPGEILGLRVMDVIADGRAVALAAYGRGGKTKNARRILPLHTYAAAVVSARMSALPDMSPEASLWSEVPVQGGDKRRTKTIATRFVQVRRRLLPASNGVDLYSLRRSFLTAAETAKNAKGRLDNGIIARLAGHGQGHLALDIYSDWSRLGRPELSGELLSRLATLSDAVNDILELGFSKDVRQALKETANLRPVMVRTAPAFSRRYSSA